MTMISHSGPRQPVAFQAKAAAVQPNPLSAPLFAGDELKDTVSNGLARAMAEDRAVLEKCLDPEFQFESPNIPYPCSIALHMSSLTHQFQNLMSDRDYRTATTVAYSDRDVRLQLNQVTLDPETRQQCLAILDQFKQAEDALTDLFADAYGKLPKSPSDGKSPFNGVRQAGRQFLMELGVNVKRTPREKVLSARGHAEAGLTEAYLYGKPINHGLIYKPSIRVNRVTGERY